MPTHLSLTPGARRRRAQRQSVLPALALGAALGGPAFAQTPPPGTNGVTRLPEVIVTAQKIPQDADVVPLNVTAVPKAVLEAAGVRNVEAAGIYSPNL